jgi:hypothetical protein
MAIETENPNVHVTYCNQCGATLPGSSLFCPKCGARQSADEAEPSVAQFETSGLTTEDSVSGLEQPSPSGASRQAGPSSDAVGRGFSVSALSRKEMALKSNPKAKSGEATNERKRFSASVWTLGLVLLAGGIPIGSAFAAVNISVTPKVALGSATKTSRWIIPAVNRRNATGAAALLQLPRIDTALRDGPSRQALALFDSATLARPRPALTAFVREFTAAEADAGVHQSFGYPLSFFLPNGYLSASPQSFGAGNPEQYPFFNNNTSALVPDIQALTSTASNAERLSNAAAYLFDYAVATHHMGLNTSTLPSSLPQEAALRLLAMAYSVDRKNEHVALNNAFVALVMLGSSTAMPLLRTVIRQWPRDWSARLLLANLYANSTYPAPAQSIAALLAPLQTSRSSDAKVAALSLLGDVSLQAAIAERPLSPLLTQEDARASLRFYDSALGFERSASLCRRGDRPHSPWPDSERHCERQGGRFAGPSKREHARADSFRIRERRSNRHDAFRVA